MTNIYESDLLVDQYLLFHYGTAEDQLPYPAGPRDSLFYPIRCVSEFLPAIGFVEHALDLTFALGPESGHELALLIEIFLELFELLDDSFDTLAKSRSGQMLVHLSRSTVPKTRRLYEERIADAVDVRSVAHLRHDLHRQFGADVPLEDRSRES